MKRSALAIVMLLALALAIPGCAHKQRALYDPAPISVLPSSANRTKVRNAIREGLRAYKWIIEKDRPGLIVARQARRSHTARVRIKYSARNVDIDYVDSTNLNFHVDETGTKRIHGAYNTWVTNLERIISSRVN